MAESIRAAEARSTVAVDSGVAGLAALCAFRQSFAGVRVAVPLYGSNATPEQVRRWLPA
jgi:hypothetical protein